MAMRRRRDAEIQLELGGALAPPLAREHGVGRREVERVAGRLREPLDALLGSAPPSGFLAVLKRPAVLREVQEAARRWRRRGVDDVIHVGIGGSALGAETVLRALAHPFHNAIPRRRRGGPRVHFLDNVDPDTLGALLEHVDLRRSLVHVVSKSGGTVETAAGFQALREALGRGRRGVDWRRRCVFTTGRGALRTLAEEQGVETLAFPEDVGGRFSVLTASGLFTPALAGVDVGALVEGARRMRRRLAREDVARTPAAVAAAVSWLLAEERGKPVHVLMPSADALEPLARWWVQLVGESLGKRREATAGGDATCVGPTPLPARGTTDQHSQVQLFVDGP
ncbi:MAG: glucose-6-phosphate isomerase, partial [Myxococcota bacterium]|nr:glucose-6-phosphate isomerase [Myxococcota bacterium]